MASTRGKDVTKDEDKQDETSELEKVRLRYLGPSHTFVDSTGVTFRKDGRAKEVTAEDAARLLRQPYESFDRE